MSNTDFLQRIYHSIQSWLPGKEASFHDSVAELIEEHDPEGTSITAHERELLYNLLRFGNCRVSDIMLPRADIIAVEDTISLAALHQMFAQAQHTRLPVYHDSLDNVLGFVHIKDLVQHLTSPTSSSFALETILRKPLFIPPSMKVMDLLIKMRAKRVHMAFVLDEYGGTDGLVTLEDLMEEIVGEIEDEHDEVNAHPEIKREGKDLIANARISIETLEQELGLSLHSSEHTDFDTLGGLIFSLLGYVPTLGEEITHESGVRFTILDADSRKIRKVKITPTHTRAP